MVQRAQLARWDDARKLPAGFSFEEKLRRSMVAFLDIGRRDRAGGVLARALGEAFASVTRGAIDAALRQVDRAWRIHTAHGLTIAPIYGQLLVLAAQDDHAALGMLRHASDLAPHPDLEATRVFALLRLRRFEDALRELQHALTHNCVRPGDLLACTARYAARHPQIAANGWAARGPRLELVGELPTRAERPVLTVQCDGQSSPIEVRTSGRHHAFKLTLPVVDEAARYHLTANATPLLLGGIQQGSIDFGLDGRIHDLGRRVSGWTRLDWSPQMRLAVRAQDETGHGVDAVIAPDALPGGRWGFCIDRRAARFRGSRIEVVAQLPDGRWQPLPDSPLLLRSYVRRPGREPAPLREWKAGSTLHRRTQAATTPSRPIDVIIPVFRGREETLACIKAARDTIDDDAHLVVINDASDDVQLVAALREMATRGQIELLSNAQNRGFVSSANRGLALHPSHDVVLLNSDTVVFGDWLARMRSAAYSAATVGTVTPWSNSGSIASYPQPGGSVVDVEMAAHIHATAAAAMNRVTAEIPVGIGFCLYIRRDCLNQVGVLDEHLFGTGYGEETDFCLRALTVGWSHRLAADVFVYHAGGVSFGRRREALLQRSRRLIDLRYPGYERRIRSFVEQDPLLAIRRSLDEKRCAEFAGRFALLVSLPLGGGVGRFVMERGRALQARGVFPMVLRAVAAGNSRLELWTDALQAPNLRYEIPRELPRLAGFLQRIRLQAIEIHHFLHLDAQVIEVVRSLGIPYEVFVHDYVWICPRVTMIDGTGQYCGEPPVSVCRTCVRRHGSRLGEKLSVPALRQRSERWLQDASRVIAPSHDTALRLRRHFAHLQVEVRPHSAPGVPKAPSPSSPQRKTKRIALIGAIGTHKGYRVLLACARDARRRKLPIEFVVIGYTENDAALMATGRVFITGEYGEAEVPHLLRREQPALVWLPSVWPETWCYTLDHALAFARPVVAFDVGAIAERLRTAGIGELLPLDLEPRLINDRMLEIANADALPRQDAVTIFGTNEKEASPMNTSTQLPAAPLRDGDMSASLQVLPLPAGLYLFSVKAGGSPAPARTGNGLSLPALHVGLGPGVSAQQVEFMAGPSTHGAWLFAATDVLIAKVSSGATLVLTSVRGPGGEVLSIVVERLENRAEATATAAAAAAVAALTTQMPPASPPIPGDSAVPLQITAHIATRGDVSFVNAPWAGRAAPGLWIESFAIRPLEQLSARDIEYKALTGSGFETQWLSDNAMCGTRGMTTPLIGFAIRLKAGPAAAAYACEYSGYFKSGTTVGPVRDGAPCRSSVANDSLEGIQFRLIKRAGAPSAGTLPDRNPRLRGKGKPAAPPARARRTRAARR